MSPEVARQFAIDAGREAMRARVNELVARGWVLHSGQLGDHATLSASSYRVPKWATILLLLGTLMVWAIPAAWLQRRRDTCTLTLGHDFRLIETRHRGW